MNRILFSAIIFAFLAFSCKQETTTEDFSAYVDPYIGSDYHGHVFVGANVPFGAVQLGPNNAQETWDWCSGYHYSDSVLIGFAHTHLSGTGIGDLGDLLFMPVSDEFNYEQASNEAYPWSALYSHNDEQVSPGYYSININEYNVQAELTATERVGFQKYNFNAPGNSKLIIDLAYGTGWDNLTKADLQQEGDHSISGFRYSSGWAKDQKVYFHTEFSKAIKTLKILRQNDKGINTVQLEFEGNGELLVKTAISPVSTNGAKNNLSTELTDWNFAATKQTAREKWNTELGKIKIETTSPSNKTTFYTALYHTMIAPSLFDDVNGDYRGADGKNYTNPGYDTYTTFSLWDTYRAAHPLFTLVQPERVNDMVNTMLSIYDQQGKLPVWHLHGNETNTMVGNHAIPVIADAYLKGFTGFDAEKAFEAVKSTMLMNERGLNFIKEKGYIPADSTVESVAMALEYAIDDWCVAAMAKKLGKTEDFELFAKRAKYYENYFNKETGFMRGRMADGSWRTPFNPVHSEHRADDYCEGNAWQYTWLVPHDINGLIDLFDNETAFAKKLDELFITEETLNEGASNDISGLIGMYAHGNEPGHHVPYMFAFAGQQWKAAKRVNFILNEMYTDQPDGLCGNEDCGQMSAWYVFSSLGFYPVNPANGVYVFGSPLFESASIELANDKTFQITAKDLSKTNIYIDSVTLNGKTYTKSYITHSDLLKGGILEFTMTAEPNKDFGQAEDCRPKSGY
ncbi:GH92 family glycosyl hydrolase [Draconibacterium halophilum]|uniref:Glycoside hydrolase family 92 protein n=1 Tax=Draconibacterium halophilum TaxID=2706887 RepID=A0A6C0RDD7_9BACT|nr:GH92 family glycosyl hydrolase [Draconibacterium halophilum]QIA08668.1 glycoside hydrolase family 92 protein [Draconibacterium halophilum]